MKQLNYEQRLEIKGSKIKRMKNSTKYGFRTKYQGNS